MASTSLIRPIKIGDDKSKAPASFPSLAGAWLIFSRFYLDSTFAASESQSFRRDSCDDRYCYDISRARLHHQKSNPVYEFTSNLNSDRDSGLRLLLNRNAEQKF